MPLVPPKNAFGYKSLIIKLKFLPPDVVILIYSVGSIAKHAIYEQSFSYLYQPPFHREVRHLQVVEIVVKNFSMMGCDQGATTPSYWAGRLA